MSKDKGKFAGIEFQVLKNQRKIENNRLFKLARKQRVLKTTPEDLQNKRLISKIRGRLYYFLRTRPTALTLRDLGCTLEEFTKHIESQFSEGMTWDNWSVRGWHLDHIKPLTRFNLKDPAEFLKAVHYTNLRPLWWKDNLSKGGKGKKINAKYLP